VPEIMNVQTFCADRPHGVGPGGHLVEVAAPQWAALDAGEDQRAIAAAQYENRGEADELLTEAEEAADRLGDDLNLRWTAFGPTNASLHRVNIAVTLGDAGTAIDVARAIEYLIRERLADNIDSGNVDSRYSRPWPTLQITQAGLRCIEEFDGDARAMRETERYTSMGNNNFVNSPNINSAIQVGTTGSSQNHMPISDERQLAEQFVRLTRTLVESCEDDNLKLSLEAQISVIEGELAAEQPRWELLRKLGGSIQKICESAIGGAFATALIKFPWPHI
jgi:hypothetical protein